MVLRNIFLRTDFCLLKKIRTYGMMSYINTRFVCTDAALCMSASSDQSSVYQKTSIGSWAPDWTFPISATQCFISEVAFLDHCSSNRCSGDMSASLLKYVSFLGIISWMQCLVCPLESLVLWINALFWESVEWNIVSRISWQQSRAQRTWKTLKRLPTRYSFIPV